MERGRDRWKEGEGRRQKEKRKVEKRKKERKKHEENSKPEEQKSENRRKERQWKERCEGSTFREAGELKAQLYRRESGGGRGRGKDEKNGRKRRENK